jgi:hypothetical protein
MRTRRGTRALSALPGLLAVLAVVPGVGRAAEGVPPDLAVEYVGPNPNNHAEMLFRVTNVGKWWVAETEATVAKAALGYGEGSTTRRSASGESEYGVLPTCNTQLGIAAPGWGGGLDRVVGTTPAAVVGASGVTTGSFGAWDVTPQVKQWLEGAEQEENRERLAAADTYNYEPKGILVVGHTGQLDDLNKKATFELFRRNLHNPEIVTYDELLARAEYLCQVEQATPPKDS